MTSRSPEIAAPKAGLGLDELLAIIQGLDEPSRARVAQVLAEVEMDTRLKELIEQLAARAPADDITDADIDAEVRSVRAAARPA